MESMESHFGQKGIEFKIEYRVTKITPRTTGKLIEFRIFDNRVPSCLKQTYRNMQENNLSIPYA